MCDLDTRVIYVLLQNSLKQTKTLPLMWVILDQNKTAFFILNS